MTEQLRKWAGEFGRSYTKRNNLSLEESESLHFKKYGLSRAVLNDEFLGAIGRNLSILEIGSNIGNQLLCLQKMGFNNLYGLEPQGGAVKAAKMRAPQIKFIEGEVFNPPFKDGYFDLVFTSGVLIHIAPECLKRALTQVYRCASRYIWGFEYFSDGCVEIEYRGERNLLWKNNFSKAYLDLFGDLELVKEKKLRYLDSGNVDSMFLLVKKLKS